MFSSQQSPSCQGGVFFIDVYCVIGLPCRRLAPPSPWWGYFLSAITPVLPVLSLPKEAKSKEWQGSFFRHCEAAVCPRQSQPFTLSIISCFCFFAAIVINEEVSQRVERVVVNSIFKRHFRCVSRHIFGIMIADESFN